MKGTQPSGLWKVADLWTRPLSLHLTPLPKHHMQPILKILLDLLMSSRRWWLGTCVLRCFPKWQSTRQLLIGLDVRAGIKADGFVFYAINSKPYGLPINRPHPFNSPLFRLFPFETMRSEGLCLDFLFCIENQTHRSRNSWLARNTIINLTSQSWEKFHFENSRLLSEVWY